MRRQELFRYIAAGHADETLLPLPEVTALAELVGRQLARHAGALGITPKLTDAVLERLNTRAQRALLTRSTVHAQSSVRSTAQLEAKSMPGRQPRKVPCIQSSNLQSSMCTFGLTIDMS